MPVFPINSKTVTMGGDGGVGQSHDGDALGFFGFFLLFGRKVCYSVVIGLRV